MTDSRPDPEAEVEDALYQAAISGNVAAIAQYLRRTSPRTVEDRIASLLGRPEPTGRQILAMIRERLDANTPTDHPGVVKRERARMHAILDEVERLGYAPPHERLPGNGADQSDPSATHEP